jgi:hypothetical protein
LTANNNIPFGWLDAGRICYGWYADMPLNPQGRSFGRVGKRYHSQGKNLIARVRQFAFNTLNSPFTHRELVFQSMGDVQFTGANQKRDLIANDEIPLEDYERMRRMIYFKSN